MSCANTEAASVAVTMTNRVVGGHAALRGAICTWPLCQHTHKRSSLICSAPAMLLLKWHDETNTENAHQAIAIP